LNERTFYLALGFDPCRGEPMTLVVTVADVPGGTEIARFTADGMDAGWMAALSLRKCPRHFWS